MTNLEQLKNFRAENKSDFFAKYPKPSRKGARAAWKNVTRWMANQEAGDCLYFTDGEIEKNAENFLKSLRKHLAA